LQLRKTLKKKGKRRTRKADLVQSIETSRERTIKHTELHMKLS
jgi:hypothetical protein